MSNRRIRMGMLGGGAGAFIGEVHRMAARLDGQIELVCGCFSRDRQNNQQTGQALYLPPHRVYGNYQQMINAEANLPDNERMDFMTIATPNHLHYEPAKLAIEKGFGVMCDKPLTPTVAQASELLRLARQHNTLFGVTFNYTGYPMVKQARHMVATGLLGNITKVVVQYPQGWLATPIEAGGQKQALWRTNPSESGGTNCLGDIGTHAFNMAEYVSGLTCRRVLAQLNKIVPNRPLDDDANLLLDFGPGTSGMLYASQIAAGQENPFGFSVYGQKGGLIWNQMQPNVLTAKWVDAPTQVLRTGTQFDLIGQTTREATRIVAGHPEGFIEAFANLYKYYAAQYRHKLWGQPLNPLHTDVPTAADGLRAVQFVEAALQSSAQGQVWVNL